MLPLAIGHAAIRLVGGGRGGVVVDQEIGGLPGQDVLGTTGEDPFAAQVCALGILRDGDVLAKSGGLNGVANNNDDGVLHRRRSLVREQGAANQNLSV